MFAKRTRILVVDDEPTICRALQIALGRMGHDVVTTESGECALTLLRAEHFDCLVVDLRIPDLRGDVLFELAASIQPHLRKQSVFITGDTSTRGGELIDACGCPLLSKPFDLRELMGIVDRLVRHAQDQTA
ncbi:MAG: response regulator [Gemmatimonadota bacterium]|nr:response regulator [Gemmatimonadota bacterium]